MLDTQTVNKTEVSDIGVKRAYLLWLWMSTLKNETFERLSDGGDLQTGQISQGALTLEQTMTTMSMEFPTLIIAKFIDRYRIEHDMDCSKFYNTFIGLPLEYASRVCYDSKYFNTDDGNAE